MFLNNPELHSSVLNNHNGIKLLECTLYIVQCTLGCGTFFFKIPFRRAFDSPGPGNFRVAYFSNNHNFKVWDLLLKFVQEYFL